MYKKSYSDSILEKDMAIRECRNEITRLRDSKDNPNSTEGLVEKRINGLQHQISLLTSDMTELRKQWGH